MENIYIANNIKKMCKIRGVSVKQLLTDCGISKSFIYDLEKRQSSPSCDKIISIADYFNCSIDFLLGRTNKLNTNVEFFNNQLTEQEQRLLNAYRQNPNMQEAVNRLLRTETNITRAVRIARSNTSSVEVVYDDFSDLDNAPETDEDL